MGESVMVLIYGVSTSLIAMVIGGAIIKFWNKKRESDEMFNKIQGIINSINALNDKMDNGFERLRILIGWTDIKKSVTSVDVEGENTYESEILKNIVKDVDEFKSNKIIDL